MHQTPRWNKLSEYFLYHFSARVQKIPLDAGASCPNRDGTLSREGCIFCNPQGSGTGFGMAGLDLEGQWFAWREYFRSKGISLFMAYLQSFSNTYGPIEQLESILGLLARLPDMIGLSVGTRPDCLDADKLTLLAAQPQSEKWLEIGVQSCHDATLTRIRRGHSRACAEQAILAAHEAGLKVCVHLMAGLPGESAKEFLGSVRWLAAQPVDGVKFHSVYVCRDTVLADMFARGEYAPLKQGEYVTLMAEALPLLRPEIIVHRTTGDPFSGEMLAPDWVIRSRDTNNKLLAELARRNTWQGKDWNIQQP